MKELVSLDVFYDKPDCPNATQHCNNREPPNYCKVKELQTKLKPCVLAFSSGFQICQSRENKVQRSEPNSPTDGHKVPKEWHGCGYQGYEDHVNGSEDETN